MGEDEREFILEYQTENKNELFLENNNPYGWDQNWNDEKAEFFNATYERNLKQEYLEYGDDLHYHIKRGRFEQAK